MDSMLSRGDDKQHTVFCGSNERRICPRNRQPSVSYVNFSSLYHMTIREAGYLLNRPYQLH